jgi:hypothetical protein
MCVSYGYIHLHIMSKISEKSCLAKETQTHRYALLAGIIMCSLGFVIFLNFSSNDFLTSGFTERGLLIDTQLPSQESVSSTLHIDEIKRPVTLIISNENSPVAFSIRIENSQGMAVYNANVLKPIVTFVPDISGDYLVFIKNLSSKDTNVSISYGYLHNSENISLFSILWAFLIIGGNYLIIHTYFSGARNRSYFTH